MGDKRVRIYRCADDEVGIFSAIYEAGISGYGHKYIKIQPQSADYMYSMELFADYIDVESSIKKMNSVLDAIKEKISHEAYEYVMKAIVSGDAGIWIYSWGKGCHGGSVSGGCGYVYACTQCPK